MIKIYQRHLFELSWNTSRLLGDFSDLDFLLEDFILGASFHPGEGESLSPPCKENGHAEKIPCEDRRVTH